MTSKANKGCCVSGPDPCCQSRLFQVGGVQTIYIDFELWGDTTASAGGILRCPTGNCETLLHTKTVTLRYETPVPPQYDQPLNLFTGSSHPIGRFIYRPAGWYASDTMEIGNLGNLVFNGHTKGFLTPQVAKLGRLVFIRLATFTTQNPTSSDVPGIGNCVVGWSFDEDLLRSDGQNKWDRYLVDFRSVCFNQTPSEGFRPWNGKSPGPNIDPQTFRGMWFAGAVPVVCYPLLMNLTAPLIFTSRTTLYPGAVDYARSCGGTLTNLASTAFMRGTITA